MTDNNENEYTIDNIPLPKDIFHFNNLKNILILNIINCNLTQLPLEIDTLQNLIILNLSNNKLTNIELSNPKLVVLDCAYNKLTTFPTFKSQIQCLNIINNNISSIPYKKIEEMRLVVFLYADNPFLNKISDKKNLLILESRRQKFLVELYHYQDIVDFFHLEMKPILENYENKQISYSALKCLEESIYEDYFMYEFYQKIKHKYLKL